jgi:hypothetical protein
MNQLICHHGHSSAEMHYILTKKEEFIESELGSIKKTGFWTQKDPEMTGSCLTKKLTADSND